MFGRHCNADFCKEENHLKAYHETNSQGNKLTMWYCRIHRGLPKDPPITLQDCVAALEEFDICHFSSGCPHDVIWEEVLARLKELAYPKPPPSPEDFSNSPLYAMGKA